MNMVNIPRAKLRALLVGEPPENLSCLALKILLGRHRLALKQDPSPANVEARLDSLSDFFVKNEKLVANDLERLIGRGGIAA